MNKVFLSEWESMEFLSHNGMDFKRVFQFGVPFKRIGEKDEGDKKYVPLVKNGAKYEEFFSEGDRKTIEGIE